MAEIASTYPTAGGLYYWASKLGGPVWGWFTGWFNLIGLIAVTASVDYGCATFVNPAGLGFYRTGDFVFTPTYSFGKTGATYLGRKENSTTNK